METKTRDRSSRSAGRADEDDDAIDPRIRARRILVKRDEDRSRLSRLIIVLGLLAVVAGSVAALRSPLLDVDHVRVAGARRTSPARIAATSGVRRGISMGDVKLGAASQRVATLPWVLRATVKREWPGTVRIEVTERSPEAEIRRSGGGWLLVDRTGRLLARSPSRQPGLIKLTGLESALPGDWLDTSWDDSLHVARSLPADIRGDVASVARDGRGSALLLTDSVRVVLGEGADLAAKLEALRTLLAQPDRHCFASINLRVATAPALTRRPGCA